MRDYFLAFIGILILVSYKAIAVASDGVPIDDPNVPVENPNVIAYPLDMIISGHVTKVMDGNTIYVRHDKKLHKIQLYGIDAPELKQSYGEIAKEELKTFIGADPVECVVREIHRLELYVADCFIGHNGAVMSLSQFMVMEGHAWVDTRYNINPTLPGFETYARDSKEGIWSTKNPTPPWEWRKQQN